MLKRDPFAGLLLAATIGAGLVLPPAELIAQQGSATANMQVHTQVVRKCAVTAGSLRFGTYDPVQANSTAPLDSQGGIIVKCTKGVTVMIGLDNGTNAQGQGRRMSGGGNNLLAYELYKDPARTERWGDSGGERVDGGVAPSHNARSWLVYGRVPGGQDVAEGNYQDTVLVTVQF